VESPLTLLAPYVAWVLAETVHASGVLACSRRLLCASIFQRCRGADDAAAVQSRVGYCRVYPQRHYFHSDRSSTGRHSGRDLVVGTHSVAVAQRAHQRDRHYRALGLGTADCLSSETLDALAQSPRSHATDKSFIPCRLDRHARDRVARGRPGTPPDGKLGRPFSLPRQYHRDDVRRHPGHAGGARTLAHPDYSYVEAGGRRVSGTRGRP